MPAKTPPAPYLVTAEKAPGVIEKARREVANARRLGAVSIALAAGLFSLTGAMLTRGVREAVADSSEAIINSRSHSVAEAYAQAIQSDLDSDGIVASLAIGIGSGFAGAGAGQLSRARDFAQRANLLEIALITGQLPPEPPEAAVQTARA